MSHSNPSLKNAGITFAEAGLPCVPVPQPLEQDFREWGSWSWGSWSWGTTDLWESQEEKGPIPWYHIHRTGLELHPYDRVLFKHVDSGLASSRLFYSVSYGIVNLFLIMPWGNIYDSASQQTRRAGQALTLVDSLLEKTSTVKTPPYSLQVFGSDLHPSWWQAPGDAELREEDGSWGQVEVLRTVLDWVHQQERIQA